ncbi:cogc-5, partial [Pristionchus pacificus]
HLYRRMSHPSAVDSLEDYVWGRIRECDYLEKVARADSETADAILARVQLIDTDLNRQLRKGVEENLSRLLDQTTALEGLERRQKNVHVQMDYVKEGCSRIAQSLALQLHEYREGVKVAGRLQNARNILGDAMRCEELMDQFDKRRDLVKRSEIICEMRWIVKECPSLHEISWLVPTIGERMKKATNELQSSSSEELRRGLDTLNASTVSAALRALKNLGSIDGELESVLTRAMSSLDSSFLELAAAPTMASSLLPSVVNGVATQMEQSALLGENHLTKVCERLGRTMRARVPLDAPYALRLVQSLSRVISSSPLTPSSLNPLVEAMRPLKHAILTQSLSRLHEVINDHDLSASAHSSRFVEVLTTRMEEELRQLEWDSELHGEATKNLGKCFDLVTAKIESALKLDGSSLLLGERISSTQHSNYRLLQCSHSLASHWPPQAQSLLRLHRESTSLLTSSVVESIDAILATMHGEKMGERREGSLYMQELVSYLSRLSLHSSHSPSALGRSDIVATVTDRTLLAFLVHASLVRPMEEESVRVQLRKDLDSLLNSLDEVAIPVGLPSYSKREDVIMNGLFKKRMNEIISSSSHSSSIPSWLLVHFLIADSPSDLMSPHESVQYTKEEYVKWVLCQADPERLKILSGLLDAYTATVVHKGGTSYVSNYPLMVELIEESRKRIGCKA